jgi:hypothetical protein
MTTLSQGSGVATIEIIRGETSDDLDVEYHAEWICKINGKRQQITRTGGLWRLIEKLKKEGYTVDLIK